MKITIEFDPDEEVTTGHFEDAHKYIDKLFKEKLTEQKRKTMFVENPKPIPLET